MKKWIIFALLTTIVLYPLLASAEDDHYARGIVIQSLVPNKLGVGGAEFKTKNNTKGDGVFVFNPKTEFNGTKRYWGMHLTHVPPIYCGRSPRHLQR